MPIRDSQPYAIAASRADVITAGVLSADRIGRRIGLPMLFSGTDILDDVALNLLPA